MLPRLGILLACFVTARAGAEILWTDPGSRVIHNTPDGQDILGGATRRDDTANDALYFRFEVDPLTDIASEDYLAGFQLFEGDTPHLGVGNAWEAWGYSAFGTSETNTLTGMPGEYDLKSSNPEAAGLGTFKPYELPRHTEKRTIIFKVQYVPGGDDLITVWLSPRLSRGYTDANQPENLTTKFNANGSFNQIRLRHYGEKADSGGNGWIFSNMAIATSWHDFVVVHFWESYWFVGLVAAGVLAGVVASARLAERRKYQRRLLLAEQERALERERTRIAQDLHDDLGSYLARISLLSGLAKADAHQPDQLQMHVGKIAEAADETVRALEEIVWAVRPGSDTLQSLVEYITHFAGELFEGSSTRCRLDVAENLPAHPLPPDTRHNIFLVVKEALTNVLKHAAADEVIVRARVANDTLEIQVQDDGRGFTADSKRDQGQGHGNMRRRAEAAGGTLSIESDAARGTTVALRVSLTRLPKGKK
jgi:signal transduction histidine kinase